MAIQIKKLKLIVIVLLSSFLAACQTQSSSPQARLLSSNSDQAIAASTPCQSFNLGDNLQPQLGSGSLQLNLPVARLNNPHQGRSVVLLPVADASIRFFWARQNNQGQWSIAEKQTVMQVQAGRIDASPLHRLHYNAQQQKVVLFVTLPSPLWQQGIIIKPVLEETESRWGRIRPFNTRLTAQGFFHPFRGIDQGLSGNTLPQRLAEIMNQIEPGSIYVPHIYTNKINLLKPTLVNRKLCPIAG